MWITDVKVSSKVVNQPLRPIFFPHLNIKFNFFFHTKVYTYLINVDSYSGANPKLLHSFSPEHNTTATAHIIFRERLSYDAVGKAITDRILSDTHSHINFRERLSYDAVGKAITDHILSDTHSNYEPLCSSLTKGAWENVVKSIGTTEPVPKNVELNVDLTIQMKYSYVHIIGRKGINGGSRLKICSEPETYCSICAKEIGDTVWLRMPCKHAFHGGCIVRWLRWNHNCPICGYMDWSVIIHLLCSLCCSRRSGYMLLK